MVERETKSMNDTITAIATPFGFSGIGIVRISGPKAIEIAEKLFQGKKSVSKMKGFEASYGWVVENEERLDEVIMLLMRAPKSYTREDMVEFHCHGGPIALNQVLSAVLKAGARLALPGEFTKRAFLSGRIDLSQAEAVINLISAQTQTALRASLRGLAGEMKNKINSLRQILVEILAEIEAGLDFSEEEIEFISKEKLLSELDRVLQELTQIIEKAKTGRILSQGLKIVIAGKPNVGKSTLMNALLNRDRVIVTPYPGTTRDVVEEMINLSGAPVRISDTAGIRENTDAIEKEGVARSKKAISEADLVLLLLDGSEQMDELDHNLLNQTKPYPRLVLLNKIDLDQKLSEKKLKKELEKENFIKISAKQGIGLDTLQEKIKDLLLAGKVSAEDALTASLRQIELLNQSYTALAQAKSSAQENLSEEFIASSIRTSIEFLGKISGETISEEILNLIFSKFCIGK